MKPKFLNNKIIKILVYIISISIIIYASYLVLENYSQIKEHISKGNKLFFLASLIFYTIYTVIITYAWKLIILEKIKFIDAFVIYNTTQLGKYIPGKIWVYAAQVYFLKRYNIKFKELMLKTLIFYTLFFLSAIVFSISAYGLYINNPIMIIASILGSYVFILTILKPFNTIKGLWKYIYSYTVMLFDLFLGWIATYYLIMSIYPTDLITTVLVAASAYIAWIVGFVVLVAPAGLGIREGANLWILHTFLKLPMGFASLFPLAMRFIVSVSEILTILMGIYIGKKRGMLDFSEIKRIEQEVKEFPKKENLD